MKGVGLMCYAVLLGACGDPPHGSHIDATIGAPDASNIDANVPLTPDASATDAAMPVDAQRFDGAVSIDALNFDALVSDADTSLDATTGAGLSMLSDDFEDGSLDPAWTVFRDSIVDIEESAGALGLTPSQMQLWFNQLQASFVYKNVSGNFKVTATVRPRQASAPTVSPSGTFEMGGLMARKAVAEGAGSEEDYVFVTVGYDGTEMVVETKGTNDGLSLFTTTGWGAMDAELRLCRVGDQFWLYKRPEGQPAWIQATTYVRPDMPATIQLGPLVCANEASPDLLVLFDEVTYGDVTVQADCLVD